MFFLHLVLHTVQPAAVTTVAMETSGVHEQALNRGDKGAERLTDRNRILRKEHEGLEGGQTGPECRMRVDQSKEGMN